jgi:methyltransferase-like protein/SAM-dependent methyltransferase
MQTLSGSESNTYDLVPYESVAFPQSHPDRIATVATLFGLTVPSVKSARVLELGCASGGNLIPAAYTLPDASFVGLDLSQRQIEQGQALLKELNLKNIKLINEDLMDVTKDFGQFDYIIAHGLFSWVPDTAQEQIFKICSENLSQQGVAYISYNTYPGWHFRGMIRDMMLYHAGALEDPSLRASQARALLDFLSQSVPTQDNAYGLMLRNELELISRQRDSYLLHDHMEEANQPAYFHEFMARAQQHGLQYLGESEFSSMLTSNLPKEVGETVRRISTEIVRTEQYMDFVRNRSFRQTLLCKQNLLINRSLDYQSVLPFLISSPATAQNPNLNILSDQPETFSLPSGIAITTPQPLTKAALQYLSEIWPQSVSFEELLGNAVSRLSPLAIQDRQTVDARKQLLGGDLLTAYASNAVVFRMERAPFETQISDRPKVSELARLQARSLDFVTNQLHESVPIDAFSKHLLQILNGRRDSQALLDELQTIVRQGKLVVQKDGKDITDNAALRLALQSVMVECLNKIAKAAVLIA